MLSTFAPLKSFHVLSRRCSSRRRWHLTLRSFNSSSPNQNDLYAKKYAEKLQKRADEEGKTLDELRESILQNANRQAKQPVTPEAAKLLSVRKDDVKGSQNTGLTGKVGLGSSPSKGTSTRKDSSPVKPLSDFMDISKLVRTPHTAEQISALWTVYHASRSSGTGRGYLSATIPVGIYDEMIGVARKYPAFVMPIERTLEQENDQKSDNQKAYEFHFMQWSFFGSPPPPSPDPFPLPTSFNPPTLSTSTEPSQAPNPAISTILFTPLQEYKLHQAFSTPHLILTHYTDFARTHGVVLLRGEITQTNGSGSGNGSGGELKDARYILSQQDAQLLAMGVQRFYLKSLGGAKDGKDDEGRKNRQELLRTFHERPQEFKWEELLAHANFLSL